MGRQKLIITYVKVHLQETYTGHLIIKQEHFISTLIMILRYRTTYSVCLNIVNKTFLVQNNQVAQSLHIIFQFSDLI